MATSSYKTFLMLGTGESTITYAKLLDVVSTPDLGGQPDQLDATTLSDGMQKNVAGIRKADAMTYKANYDSADFDKVSALDDGTVHHFSEWLGATVKDGVATPTGSEGKFNFDGTISVYLNSTDVNAVRQMTITITRSTPIVKVTA